MPHRVTTRMEAPLGTYAHRLNADQAEPARDKTPQLPASRQAPAALADFLKATRTQWLSRTDLEFATGRCRTAVRLWTEELAKQGVLAARLGPRQGRGGLQPLYFTLHRDWGGKAKQ